jgi:hypothetical protein
MTGALQLRRIGRGVMRKGDTAFTNIGGTGVLKALATVRTSARNVGVMVVLAVVLPSALAADFVPAPFGESDVPAAWTRIWTA